MIGVPPSGSGSRPSDGAASVSTVPASIPNAKRLWDDPARLFDRESRIIADVMDLYIPMPAPHDEDKTDEDWAEDERRSKWRQDAFNRYWLLASRYLTETVGEQQTSRDMHMVCQGFALAMTVLPRHLTAAEDMARREASAIEARRAETAETGSVEDESAPGRPNEVAELERQVEVMREALTSARNNLDAALASRNGLGRGVLNVINELEAALSEISSR